MSHLHRFRRRRLPPVVSVVVAIALVSAACASTTPSVGPTATPTPSPIVSSSPPPSSSPSGSPTASGGASVDAIYDAVESQVVAIRGLQPKRTVARQFIDEAQLRTLLTSEFDQETPPAYVAGEERLYKALGLIPAGANLRTLSLDLLSSGVEAFYRSDQSKLYVVSKSGGQPGPSERFYFSHEYDHALQDQNSTIFKDFDKVLDQSDKLLARQAIYEGDATLLMSQWAVANLSPSDLLALFASGADPKAQAVLADAPPIMGETLAFPYTTGFSYVMSVQSTGGWPAVNAYFTKMPESTEQILHPEKYTAGEAPIAVTIPADLATRLGPGWSVPLQDTFGELQLGIWLKGAGVPADAATKAAAGWGGDRLAVMNGPGGAWAVAMQTVWDTDADATEFESAAKTALAKAGGPAHVLPGAGGTTRWVIVAGDAGTLSKAENTLGLAG